MLEINIQIVLLPIYSKRKVFQEEISEVFADGINSFEPYDYMFATLKDKKVTNSEEDTRSENSTGMTIVSSYDIYSHDTYLCCFSRETDLLPMWNYYSKSQHYEGYNIGFMSDIFKEHQSYERGYSIQLKRVLYTNKEKDEILDKIILPYGEYFEEKYRNSHGYIVPYIEYSIPKETVKQIVIGPLLEDEIAKKNVSKMLQKYGYDKVIVKSFAIPIRF